MGSTTDDFPMVQDDDLIRIHDGPNPLGYDQDGRISCYFLETFSQCSICLVVKSREGIIKDIDIRLFNNCTRNG